MPAPVESWLNSLFWNKLISVIQILHQQHSCSECVGHVCWTDSVRLCHNISDTVCNPFHSHLSVTSADGIPGAAVVRQVVSDVAAILWRFSVRYQTYFRKQYSAEMYHGSIDLPRCH